jgi:hypothetical protein
VVTLDSVLRLRHWLQACQHRRQSSLHWCVPSAS